MREIVGDDERFVTRRSTRRLGFYKNFERALELLRTARLGRAGRPGRPLVPEKLATLVDAIGDANLVYSDQRIVDPDGGVIASSYWSERENAYDDLASLLVTNTVTGAASLFRRDLLETAMPFPQPPGEQYHDHWLALVALASGRIAYVDRPLYDYVQHGGATLGHAAAARMPTSLGQRMRRLLGGSAGEAALGSRAGYFYGFRRLQLLAQVLLMRCGDRMDAKSRDSLRRLIRGEALARFDALAAGRPSRARFGRAETGGADNPASGDRLAARAEGARRRSQPAAEGEPLEAPHDASLPATSGPRSPAAAPNHPFVRKLAGFIEPLELAISKRAPRRVKSAGPDDRAQAPVRRLHRQVQLRAQARGAGPANEDRRGRRDAPRPSTGGRRSSPMRGWTACSTRSRWRSPATRTLPGGQSRGSLVATTWWTAHIAGTALKELDAERFVYLVQEYEPFTHAMGSWAALAMSSYELPHYAVFSTELLREFFARHRYVVFAAGEEAGRRDSRSFQNAITPVRRHRSRSSRGGRAGACSSTPARRPTPRGHVRARADGSGCGDLTRHLRRGLVIPGHRDGRRLGSNAARAGAGDGAAHPPRPVRLRRPARELRRRPFTDADPHPSLVPLEMASAGMVTVTNSFENKTAEAMEAISGNLIAAEPTLEGIAAGLERAAAAATDNEARVRGAEVHWSKDWDTSLDEDLMEQMSAWLASC